MSRKHQKREQESATLKDALDEEMLQKLKATKAKLKKDEKQRKQEEAERKREERKQREKNKTFAELLEENPMDWRNFK